MTEAEAVRASRNTRPMMIYVYDGEDPEARDAVEEERVFFEDKVAIGARFFDCLRIEAADAAQDRILAPRATRTPALVFVRPNYEIVTFVPARFSTQRVFKAMGMTLRVDYRNSVDSVLKEQKDILKERGALEKDRAELARLDEQIAEEQSTRRRATLVRERDEIARRLGEAESALATRESALYVLDPKEPAAES